MKIGLVSAPMVDNNIQQQICEIEHYTINNSNCDLLCFGESFLQGFEGLTWDYQEDLKRALKTDSSVMRSIQDIAIKTKTAISLGFIENLSEHLFSSNIVIDESGEIIDIFRRVSVGWKERHASDMYKEGSEFHTFSLKGKTFTTAICGDLWHDNFLNEMTKISADVVLWPLYVDFSIDDWSKKEISCYAEQVQSINAPVCMINSFVKDVERSNGGCYVFYQNKILHSLEMGQTGVLEFDL